jgi:PmbA protein
MSARKLIEYAAGLGADCEVWSAVHEADELVSRGGAEERRGVVRSQVTAVTVWEDGREGAAVSIGPAGADAPLVDAALAAGRALSTKVTPPLQLPAPQPAPVHHPPRLDDDSAGRITTLSRAGAGLEVELRVRVERSEIGLERAGQEPRRYRTGVAQAQIRVTARGPAGTGYLGDQLFAPSVPGLLDMATGQLPEMWELATVFAAAPADELRYDSVRVDGRVMARLLTLVSSAFLLDSVQQGRSPLAGRLGERVCSPGVTITDDPTSPSSPLRAPWDDEGSPSQASILVEDGYLRGFLSSRRTAAAGAIVSTGSGRRGPLGETATVHAGHLVLWPGPNLGTRPTESGTVLWVAQANGAHTSNPITGDFSIGANAVLESAGERRNAGALTLAGNVFALLRAVDGNDGEVRLNRSHNTFVASPGVWTNSLTIGR